MHTVPTPDMTGARKLPDCWGTQNAHCPASEWTQSAEWGILHHGLGRLERTRRILQVGLRQGFGAGGAAFSLPST